MKKLFILAILSLTLAACTSVNLATVVGNAGNPQFVSADLQNARVILSTAYAKTANPYDQAGVTCVDKIVLHLPELNALLATPATVPSAAPVVGLFSGIADAQVKSEAVKLDLATKALLLQNGVPADVHIACSYILVEPKDLLHGLAAKKVAVGQ